MFSIRIVTVDYYMSYPIRELDVNYSEFRGTDIKQVPIIQIFGSSQTGQKTCVNIHDVFPYIYIPYDGSEPVGNISYKIASELDKALNVSLGQASSNTIHVHNIVLVSGKPLYGYHERQHQFLKIYFYNPAIIKRACSLLENGAILNKYFQPYECHINYILQFMIDYNLHGMSFVNISRAMYRNNPDIPDLLDDIPRNLILPNDIQKRTVCKYELDASASSIINREEISSGKLAVNPGISALWEDEKQRKRDKQMNSQISFTLTQERNDILPTSSHILFENRLTEKLNGEFKSDESNLDLNKSVYPAETPETDDILNASAVDHSILDTNLESETNKESLNIEMSECDKNLLEILKDLKETAHVEEGSILSQKVNELETESSDNEEQNLSLINEDIADDNSVWENSFWAAISSDIPQVDGQYDSDGYSNLSNDYVENMSNIFLYRDASEVYIDVNADYIPVENQLQFGVNKLIVHPKKSSKMPSSSKITILSDVCIKPPLSSRTIGEDTYNSLHITDNSINFDVLNNDNKVIINDVCLLETCNLVENDDFLRESPCASYNVDDFYKSEFDEIIEENTCIKQIKNNNTLQKRDSTLETIQSDHFNESLNILETETTIGPINNDTTDSLLSPVLKLQIEQSDKLKAKYNLFDRDKFLNLNLSQMDIFDEDSEESSILSIDVESEHISTDEEAPCNSNMTKEKENTYSDYEETNSFIVKIKISKNNSKPTIVEIEQNNNESISKLKESSNNIINSKNISSKLLNKSDKSICSIEDEIEIIENPIQNTGGKETKHFLLCSNALNDELILTSHKNLIDNQELRTKQQDPILTEIESVDNDLNDEKLSNIDLPETNLEVQKNTVQIHAVEFENLKHKILQWNLDGQVDSSSDSGSAGEKNSVLNVNKCGPSKVTKKDYSIKILQNNVDNNNQICQNSDTSTRVLRMRSKPSTSEIECYNKKVMSYRNKGKNRLKLNRNNNLDNLNVSKKSSKKSNDTLNKSMTKELRLVLVPVNLKSVKNLEKINYNPSEKSEDISELISLKMEDTFSIEQEDKKISYTRPDHNEQRDDIKPNSKLKALIRKSFDENILETSEPTKKLSSINLSCYSSSSDESIEEKPKRRYSKRTKLSTKKDLNEVNLPKVNDPITGDKFGIEKKNNQEMKDNTNLEDIKKIKTPVSQRLTRSKNISSVISDVSCRTKIISKELSSPKTSSIKENEHPEANQNLSKKLLVHKIDASFAQQIKSEKSPETVITTSSSSETEIVQNTCEVLQTSKYNIKKSALNKSSNKPAKKNKISPKYSPLHIIRSPRKQNVVPSDDEPITKRLRSHVAGIEPIPSSSYKYTKEHQKKIQGSGELQTIPGLLKEVQTSAKIVEKLNIGTEDCDTTYTNPDSIKKKLFISNDNPLNITVTNEFRSCIYENSKRKTLNKLTELEITNDLSFIKELKQNEEILLKKFEQKIGIRKTSKKCSINSHACEETEDCIKENVPYCINQVSSSRKIVNKKDENPLQVLPEIFDTAEPKVEKCSETLLRKLTHEDEEDIILENIEKYYTKMDNLTVSELYDLENNFFPQPSTSKSFDENLKDSKVDDTFSYDISLMDDTIFKQSQVIDSSYTDETSNIWMPKYFPPTSQDIKNTLSTYNIPEYRYQKPFYSKYSDVTKKMDIGHNVLKITSTTASDYEEFQSSIGFSGIEKWRENMFQDLYPCVEHNKNLKVTLAGHKEIIITPVHKPPSKKDIVSWIKIKNAAIDNTPVLKPEKPRIIIPSSPGNSNDSFNESFTISPCSPNIDSPIENIIYSSQGTPTSSKNSSIVSRKGKSKKNGNLQRKVLFIQQKSQELKLLNFSENQSSNDSCQITGVTLNNTHGFEMSLENLQEARTLLEYQYLTILVTEVHVRTRGDNYPDPQYDSIRAIFYSILNDVPEDFELPRKETGVIVVDTLPGTPTKQTRPILDGIGMQCKLKYVKSEIDLVYEFINLVRKWDPDIFVGFEIEMLSWGYLIERSYVIGINLPIYISRLNPDLVKNKSLDNKSEELKLTGRIILDAWRLFRHEIALQSYTFENLMYHILHRRVPAHSFRNLSFWWEYRLNYYRYITVNYYVTRVEGVLKLLDQLDLIGRTSELARLFGIQFYEVLSRGSQFRVESMMLRLSKPLNYIPISPSVQQRAKMRAPEWVPLILEPESRFYTDPLIVLDFQSLYPSIIIAYNYCFSTCIGRVENLGTNIPFEFGACQLKIPRSCLRKLNGKINFSPCGVGFVKPEVRQGILPRMLKEILETRLMVKASMKENKENKLLQRVLHSRQLGLKLIANVTYGYTSANFSGRMPCSEVGDSVVSKGRETLERAIRKIEQTEKWRARVVYGDTDSLFVLVPGRSREDAFQIGLEIAEAVTNDNPPPVKLKLEKVYHPSILQTKKRYVGYMYESAEQKEPEYNAKGIETVRRDGCPAVAKMLEKSLRILFETRDVSLVKKYVCRQFEKLLTGRASIQDLIFAREYRGSSGYRPGACVPALELARKWTAVDKRREPRRGERVPYIIVHGPPGFPLIRLVRSPMDLLDHTQNISLRPNAIYYITKVIAPPLNRCLTLIGADVQNWFNEMPRKQSYTLPTDIHLEKNKKSTISQYFATMNCVVCNNQTRDGLCEDCVKIPQQSTVILQEKIQQWERSFDEVKKICYSCCGRAEYSNCVSLDCPVLYRLNQIKKDVKQVPFLRSLISKFSPDF